MGCAVAAPLSVINVAREGHGRAMNEMTIVVRVTHTQRRRGAPLATTTAPGEVRVAEGDGGVLGSRLLTRLHVISRMNLPDEPTTTHGGASRRACDAPPAPARACSAPSPRPKK